MNNKTNQIKKNKELLAISFYLTVNGVIEINKLIELLQTTNISLTKEELLEHLQKNYLINNNLIYLNEFALNLDNELNINTKKQQLPYKEYTLEAINETIKDIDYYHNQIENILSSNIKNQEQLSTITNTLYNLTQAGYNPEPRIIEYLKKENIKISSHQEILLNNLVDEMYWCSPIWELNGYKKIELEHDGDDGKFEDLSIEEQAEVYVHLYTALNGAIEINKVIDIINKEHQIKLTKKEINKITKESEVISQKEKYLYMNELGEKYIEDLINNKAIKNKYKIIDDIDKITEDFHNTTDKLIDICFKYNLEPDVFDEIERIIHIGTINEELLKTILKLTNTKITPQKQQKLLKDLEIIQKNTRVWILNGYKPIEK